MSSFPTRELAIHEDCISRTDASKKKTASSLSLLPSAVAIGAVVFVFVAAVVQASTAFSATASEAIEAAPASSSTFLYLCRLRLSKAVFHYIALHQHHLHRHLFHEFSEGGGREGGECEARVWGGGGGWGREVGE